MHETGGGGARGRGFFVCEELLLSRFAAFDSIDFFLSYFAYNLGCDTAFGFNTALCISSGAGALSGGKMELHEM